MTTLAGNTNTASRSLDNASIAGRVLDSAQQFGKTNSTAADGRSAVQALVSRLQNSSNPLEQGTLLRSLDTALGGRTHSESLLRSGGGSIPGLTAQQAQAARGNVTPPLYDASSLYGQHGPRISDIRQGQMKDCALLGALGALANERPSAIRDAITYDPTTQNFSVRLYNISGTAQYHTVTQADITANIARAGGSRRDDGVAGAPVWPDIMEVARAKQVDTNHADGLDQGYNDIAAYPDEAMRVITGTGGTQAKFEQQPGETRPEALNRMGTQLRNAIQSDQPVTAWIVPESGTQQDRLVDNHVYTMTRAFQGADGNWYVTMRNPWGQNNNAAEGLSRDSAFVTMSLDNLERLGGLQSFQIGD